MEAIAPPCAVRAQRAKKFCGKIQMNSMSSITMKSACYNKLCCIAVGIAAKAGVKKNLEEKQRHLKQKILKLKGKPNYKLVT